MAYPSFDYRTNPMTIILAQGWQKLPDEGQWINRVKFQSDSGRWYKLAQDRTARYWGCSCPGWVNRKSCKHVTMFGLPNDREPKEAVIRAWGESHMTGTQQRMARAQFEREAIGRWDVGSEDSRTVIEWRDAEGNVVADNRVNRIQRNLESEMIEQAARYGRAVIRIGPEWDKMEGGTSWQHCYRRLVGAGARYITIGQRLDTRCWQCTCNTFIETRHCSHLRGLGIVGGDQPMEYIIQEAPQVLQVNAAAALIRERPRRGSRQATNRQSEPVPAGTLDLNPKLVWGLDEPPAARVGEPMLRAGHPDPSRNGMYVMTANGWQHLGNVRTSEGWIHRDQPTAPAQQRPPIQAEPDSTGQLVLDEDDV